MITKIGERWCMVIGNAVRSGGYVLLNVFFAQWVPIVDVSMLICGGGLICAPLVSALTDVTPEPLRGVTLGAFNSLGSLGQFIGPMIAGSIYSANKKIPFWIAAALSTLAAVLALAVDARKLTKVSDNAGGLEEPLAGADRQPSSASRRLSNVSTKSVASRRLSNASLQNHSDIAAAFNRVD